jgi:hypothetical protein
LKGLKKIVAELMISEVENHYLKDEFYLEDLLVDCLQTLIPAVEPVGASLS